MDWKDKMKKGMEIIKEACHDTVFCYDCPFLKYCDILSSSEDMHKEWIFDDDRDT